MDESTQALLELIFRGASLLLIITGAIFLFLGIKGKEEKRKSNMTIGIILVVVSIILFIVGNVMAS